MKAKRFLSMILCMALVFTLLPMTARADSGGYGYIDENGAQQYTGSETVTTIATDGDLSSGALGSSGTTTWYIVTGGDIQHTGTITVSGDVRLILADGASLKVTGSYHDAGINVSGTASLTIYAQSTGDDMGKLTATGGYYGAGIGGGYGGSGGNITVYGGEVRADGGS